MKKNLCLFIFSWAVNIAFAQIPNSNFANAYSDTCLYDSTKLIHFIPEWEVYQTLNDEWDGPRDSSVCIDITNTWSNQGLSIPIAGIHPNKAIFVKSSLSNQTALPLLKDNLYSINVSLSLGNNLIDTNSVCPEFICTGGFAGIKIPDSTGLSTVIRWHKGIFQQMSMVPGFCFVTERFNNQSLQQLYFRFQLQTPVSPTGTIELNSCDLQDVSTINGCPDLLNHIFVPNNQYYFPFNNTIIQYHDTTYPSPNHLSYVDVTPVPQSNQVQMIDLYVYNGGVFPQPFTETRGDTVVGGGGLRHILHWWLNNTSCIPFVEIIVSDRDIYTFQEKAQIDFGEPHACMFFANGSTMHIDKGTKFHYGQSAMGMLAWQEGMRLQLDRGSELAIHNQLMLKSLGENSNVKIELPSGSKLRFTATSGIHPTPGSPNQAVKLEVYMKGGILDDSQLSAEYKDKIVRIYDEPAATWERNVLLFPNPSKDNAFLRLTVAENTVIDLSLNDNQGRIIKNWQESLQKGENTLPLSPENLSKGIYFLTIKKGNEAVLRKWNVE